MMGFNRKMGLQRIGTSKTVICLLPGLSSLVILIILLMYPNIAFSKDKYVSEVLCELPIRYLGFSNNSPEGFNSFDVDPDENIYLLSIGKGEVHKYSRDGVLQNVFKTPLNTNKDFRIKVDEKGDIFLFYGLEGLIYNNEGVLEKDFEHKTGFYYVAFSNGTVYLETTGEIIETILDKPPELKQKIFYKNNGYMRYKGEKYRDGYVLAVMRKMGDDEYRAPSFIDGYKCGNLAGYDYSENIYIDYVKNYIMNSEELQLYFKDMFKPPPPVHRTYKFNPKLKLLARFEFSVESLNKETQTIFNIEKKIVDDVEITVFVRYRKK